MGDNSDTFGKALFIGCCLGALIFVAANGLSCLPNTCQPFWMGDKGYAELLIELLTLVAVSVAATLAYRSYLLNQAIHRSARFQKGVELIADEHESARFGGISVLEEIAKESSAYTLPVIAALNGLIIESDRGFKDERQFFDIDTPPRRGLWPQSRYAVAEALVAIGRVSSHTWRADDPIWTTSCIIVTELFLSDKGIERANFSNFRFLRSILHDARFAQCDFKNAELLAVVGKRVRFEGGTYDGARLTFWDSQRQLVVPNNVNQLQFIGVSSCDGATVNGQPMSEWIAHQEGPSIGQ